MKLNEMPKAAILHACNEIKSKNHNHVMGICDLSLSYFSDEALAHEDYTRDKDFDLQDKLQEILCDCFKKWPLFSGDEMYPVPHPDKKASMAYNMSHRHSQMYQGVYGRNRINLANFIIYTLTKED